MGARQFYKWFHIAILTGIEQLSQLEVKKQGQIWQLNQDKNRYQALASQSQAWMQTAIETQKELDALQAELQKTQAMLKSMQQAEVRSP